MRVYHRTGAAAADAIDAVGFRDGTGYYLTNNEYTGVWVSDLPVDSSLTFGPVDVTFAIDIERDVLAPYEWADDHSEYSEWLVPATLLNRYPRRRLSAQELDDMWRPPEP